LVTAPEGSIDIFPADVASLDPSNRRSTAEDFLDLFRSYAVLAR
jgi:hypothetical protein